MPLPQATCTFSHKIKAHVSGSFGLPAEFFQEGSRIMKELKSPPRNAARAGGVAAWSMATALSLALVLGLAPTQALALPQEDAPALEQASPAEEPGEQDGAAAVESADAPESPEASESPEGSTEDNGAAAAEEPSTPADAAGQGTGEASSPEGVATVLGSSSTGLALSDGGYYELGDISFSGTVILKITEAGTYTFHGSRPNTQIQVDTGKGEPVVLYLDAVTIDNSGHDLSAISIEGDSQVEIHSVNGTQTHLTDGAESSSSGHAGAGVYVNSDAAVRFVSGASIVAFGAVVDGTTQGKRAAGIGGAGSGRSDSGQITIEYGCSIDAHGATGENGGAGIGSGYDGVCHNITVLGGTILATGGPGAAGIGSGAAHGSGNGGKVDGSIQILGGTVTATGGSKDGVDGGAGVGSGASGDQVGGIAIENATVTATGGGCGAGIGSGNGGDSRGTIKIFNSTVNATGGFYAAGIGSGCDGVSQSISISDDNTHVTAYGGYWAPGIGAGNAVDLGSGGDQDGTITISGGTIKAHGGEGAPAIGAGGDNGDLNGDVTVTGGNLELVPDGSYAAIGSGGGYAAHFNSTITISGGTIWDEGESWIVNDGRSFVFGTSHLASWGDDGYVKITGGTVLLDESHEGWSAGKPGRLIIAGGSVRSLATGAVDGQGNAVYRVALPVADVDAAITSITTSASYVSGNDVHPDENGYVYLYLPATSGTRVENKAALHQGDKTYCYRDNHTTDTGNNGSLKMDDVISFEQADGTLSPGDTFDLALTDSDASWDRASWNFSADGAAKIADGSSTASPDAMAKVEATGPGPYSVTATLAESKYYWGAEASFTGTVLEPASISLGSLTKRYDGTGISLDGIARTDSDGRLSYVFEQLRDGAWQRVDASEVVAAGRYRVTATTGQTSTHLAGTATREFDILPASEGTGSPCAAQTSQASSLPSTGDATQPMAPVALGALGAAAVAGALALRSRRKRG